LTHINAARAAIDNTNKVRRGSCLRCCELTTSERATAKSLREEGSRDYPLKVRAGVLYPLPGSGPSLPHVL